MPYYDSRLLVRAEPGSGYTSGIREKRRSATEITRVPFQAFSGETLSCGPFLPRAESPRRWNGSFPGRWTVRFDDSPRPERRRRRVR